MRPHRYPTARHSSEGWNPFLLLVFCILTAPAFAQERTPLEAKTANGDVVILHPNGRWEYRDVQKQAAAKEVADQYPENRGCPPGWQGGLFGVGRCIPPGDRDFNRGSLKR